MPYLGSASSDTTTNFKKIDDISKKFNGKNKVFSLTSSSSPIYVTDIGSTFITIDGILLIPNKEYFLSSDKNSIILNDAPDSQSTFSGRLVETSNFIISESLIDPEKLSVKLKKSKTFSFNVPRDNQISYDLKYEDYEISNESDLMIFIDGLYQTPIRDYRLDNNKIVFTDALLLNSTVDIILSSLYENNEESNNIEKSIGRKCQLIDVNKCLTSLDQKIENCTAMAQTKTYGIQWVFNERMEQCNQCSHNGDCCEIANGKCCEWVVPDGARKATFEMWSGGGTGGGMTCCNCCSMGIPGAGGNWAVKTIDVEPGDTYTVCAGGVAPCDKYHGCVGPFGCTSYVIGKNLENFCVLGGCGGIMCNGDAYGPKTIQTCANRNICPFYGADFGMSGTTGTGNSDTCHCWVHRQIGGVAPFMGQFGTMTTTEYWCNCSCFIPGWAAGGLTGDSTYCGNNSKCCAGGGMGGPGLVKITYY